MSIIDSGKIRIEIKMPKEKLRKALEKKLKEQGINITNKVTEKNNVK